MLSCPRSIAYPFSMSETKSQIDFTQIDFPSDRLTVKQLRMAYPYSFDLPDPRPSLTKNSRLYARKSIDSTLGGIVDGERLLASLVFKEAIGLLPTEEETLPRHEIVEGIISDYQRVGLAGEHEAEELIRRIETQAVSQARRQGGPPR
jgi:hypothetical protein